MSVVEPAFADWLSDDFWKRLEQVEHRHQRAQTDHESARRRLESVKASESEGLREAWKDYCAVIAELDQSTAELEALRTLRR